MTSAPQVEPDATRPVRRSAFRTPSIESLVVGAFVLFGFRVGLKGISDNSSFVHLRTGIEMVKHRTLPKADPYSFTAFGHPWVVQSWFASLVYGASFRLVGGHFLLFVNGVIAGLVGGVVAILARTGSAVRTMGAASVAVLTGALYWAPRPLMFGLLALALLVLVVERRASPLWLVPIVWVWVNTHGSFPLGLAWLAARAIGEGFDLRARPRWIERYVAWFVAALALAAVNPIGPRLLLFPFAVRSKASVFKNVVEWRSPNFQTGQGLLTLVFLALALFILLRARMPWRDVLPVVGFLGLGLLSVRNIAPAAVVLAPALGRAMAAAPRLAPAVDTARPSTAALTAALTSHPSPRRINVVFLAVMVIAALVFVASAQRSPALDFKTYPTLAEDYMFTHGLLDPGRHRVASQDIVGCYLILLRGTTGRVFIDDRVDMYPVAVSNDYDTLLHGGPTSVGVLNRWQIDTVLWDTREALPGLLHSTGGWRQVFPDPSAPAPAHPDRWVVLVRDRSVPPSPIS